MKRDYLGTSLAAILFGFSLSRIGFSSWDEVHRMFTFADLRLFLTFLFAVVSLAAAWRVVIVASRPRPSWSPRPIHRGTVAGGALFGIGWALSGACPAIALVQLGEGQGLAVFSLVGMLLGNWVYGLVKERYHRWDVGTCTDD